jgi:manganese/zinc/iron transport system ATP- binding protein
VSRLGPASTVVPVGAPLPLRVRGLTVSYRRDPVVRSVDLDAPAGRVTGVVGPNGAGKSTMLAAVVGLVPADAGTVTVAGGPLDAVRGSVAYLPQRTAVDWDYPAQVREVVAMGRYPSLRLLQRFSARDSRLVDDALERVGLAGLARRQVGELSGGQQQRVFLARALAQQARLLLLDEPFVGVDALTVRLLSEVLRELAAAGATVVVVDHDLATVDALCDEVVLLARSVVVAAGPPREVLTSDALARAYGAPLRATPAAGGSDA